MWTMNFQMFKLVVEKAEEQEIKFPTSVESSKRQESSRKTSISSLLTMPKLLTRWIITNCGKFFKRWEYQTTLPVSWETCMQVKNQSCCWTGSQLGKEYIEAVCCHPAYSTSLQSTSHHQTGWSTSWNQDCWEKYQYVDDTSLIAESEEELKSFLIKVK